MAEKLQELVEESRQGEAYEPKNNNTYLSDKKYYIESYGCQMNFSDSEIVASILSGQGYGATRNFEDADLVFLNTCSIREKAEQTVRNRLQTFKKLKENKPAILIGVLGCMAERLKSKFLEEEKLVDIVVGPDAYRSLPALISEAETGQKMVNVLLSREETYADIAPVRLDSNGVSAFVSIMRGCDNMCSFCVVPFTRGRERSRDISSILKECTELHKADFKEVTLLGQNVDSYRFVNENRETFNFAQLLEAVAIISPDLRVRFSTSHPKDITDEVLLVMARHENICKYIHLPVQSGNSRILDIMNRNYTREWYLDKVKRIREIMPDCGISTDVIAGFCSETEDEHRDTLSVMALSRFDMAYMFAYSERPGTLAERKFPDDVPPEIKKARLEEIIELQRKLSTESYASDIGKTYKILIEADSKRSSLHWSGRNTQNKMVVFPKDNFQLKPGDYVNVTITSSTGATLIGQAIGGHAQTLQS